MVGHLAKMKGKNTPMLSLSGALLKADIYIFNKYFPLFDKYISLKQCSRIPISRGKCILVG